jgi:hypothetical protein
MYAFIHIPKAAGSTIATILRQSFLSRHCDVKLGDGFFYPALTAAALRRTHWVYWQLESIAGHYVVPHSDLQTSWPDIRFYTFVREPIARCVSEYQRAVDNVGLTVPFDEWIQDPLYHNRQTKHLAGCEDVQAAVRMIHERIGFVGLVERFDESLLLWRRWLGDSRLDIRYQAKNVARRNSIKKQLLSDPRAVERLTEANRLDLELYRHVKEEVYPRQVADYGPALADDLAAFERARIPRPTYPRQLPSLLLREFVFRPMTPVFRSVCKPPSQSKRAA